jgi:hypothetical protein
LEIIAKGTIAQAKVMKKLENLREVVESEA